MGLPINNSRPSNPQYPDLQPVEEVHRNPWFTVMNRGGYYTVEYHELQVMILPIVEHSQVVMVRVHRPVLRDATLELPSGGCGITEEPLAAAARELAEETGVHVNDLARFAPMHPITVLPRIPVRPLNYAIHLSQAEYDQRTSADHEIAEVVSLSFAEFERHVARGQICVGQSIAVVCQYLFAQRHTA
jgi:8-oxo-dGTP pyrophosphatase MutT (NUDIX family)